MSKPVLLSGGNGKVSELAGTANGQFLVNNGSNEVVFSSATEPTAGQVPVWSGSAWTPGSTAYDLRGSFIGNPATGVVIDRFVADRAFTISATNTQHKFWADEKTAGADVVLTVRRTRAGTTSTIFTATSASGDTILNGYYPMTISAVSNNAIQVDDLVEVVMGTTQAAFSTPVWTIYGSTP
jgi:hypothetical protein